MHWVKCIIEQDGLAATLWEVLDLNLSWNMTILTEVFMVLLSVQTNSWIVFQLGHDRILQSPSLFISYSTVCHYITCGTESSIK
jgi:hypothetical protein